jgi:hypothetical protein
MRLVVCGVVTILVFLTLPLSGQNAQPFGSLANSQSVREELGIAIKNGVQNAYTTPKKYLGIKGHPFIADGWMDGKVCLKKDSAVISNPVVKYRFDSYGNELWIYNGKDSIVAYSKDINWFEVSEMNQIRAFRKYPLNSIRSPQTFYCALLDTKDIHFVRDMKKALVRADFVDKGMYSTGSPYDRFEEKHQWLIAFGNDSFKKIKLNVKSILEEVPSKHRKAASTWVRSQKMKGKISEQEAIQLLGYVQSLIQA